MIQHCRQEKKYSYRYFIIQITFRCSYSHCVRLKAQTPFFKSCTISVKFKQQQKTFTTLTNEVVNLRCITDINVNFHFNAFDDPGNVKLRC